MFFLQLFASSGGFQPHGFCYAWNPALVWLHVVSDVLISAAYFTIPVAMMFFFRKRPDVPFGWMFALFSAFIVACGATHVAEVWNLWHASYWIAGAIKAITAVASVGTAAALIAAVPRILQVPNLTEWAKANADLEARVAQRTSELRLANDELRENRDKLRLAQRAGKIGTWEHDLVAGRSTFSPELEELFGFAPGDASRAPEVLRELLNPDDWIALETGERFLIRDGREHAAELHIVRPEGTFPHWLFSRTTVVRDAQGTPLRLVGATVDITELKKAEAQIRELNASLETRIAERTLELSNANKELESFSYSVSHDLRAPLRTIDGFSLALLEDCAEQLSEEGKSHLQRIRAATQRMGVLIDDLLNLSRVTRAELSNEKFDLSAVVSLVAQELQSAQPQRQVTWHIQPGISAKGDPRLLRVAMENLLNNAWKFTSKRSSASIAFGRTNANSAPAFFVKDDGVGFDQKYADRLFGAFQRLHDAAEFAGTGVGLATVQRVISRHGGRVWAESSVDHGATFYFTLPQSGLDGANA